MRKGFLYGVFSSAGAAGNGQRTDKQPVTVFQEEPFKPVIEHLVRTPTHIFSRGKRGRYILCKAPFGPFRQNAPDHLSHPGNKRLIRVASDNQTPYPADSVQKF